jgi:endonuclease YncB( thermonuclease family)
MKKETAIILGILAIGGIAWYVASKRLTTTKQFMLSDGYAFTPDVMTLTYTKRDKYGASVQAVADKNSKGIWVQVLFDNPKHTIEVDRLNQANLGL